MGTLVFQATLGGAINLIGPNTASTVNFTLPSADGTSGQAVSTNGSGVLSFGTLAVTAGGTGVTTSTGSGNNVLSTSPTLVTPILGTPTSGNFSTGTFTWPTFNQNTTGTAAGLSATLAVASGGTGQTSYTNGQLLIGNSTGNTLTKATLTAGTNVTITNAAGAITIAASGGGGGSPGGSTTQVQYNNAGAFGGISGVTTDGTRMTASTTIGVGGATPSTSGSGITFPATQSDSTNANTLDDYEEGTWTPSLGGNTTYTEQTAKYRKIGSLVHIDCRIKVNLIGTGSTNTISGLPFAPASGGGSCAGAAAFWENINQSLVYLSFRVDAGGLSQIYTGGATAATASLTNNIAIFKNSADVLFSITYPAA
jgi:hypothetical protein